jgi:hypothetical protein
MAPGMNSKNAVRAGDAGVQSAQPRRRRRHDKGTQSIDQSSETNISNEQSVGQAVDIRFSHISHGDVSQLLSAPSSTAPSENGSRSREQYHGFQNPEFSTHSQPPTSWSADPPTFTTSRLRAANAHRRVHSRAIDPFHLQREAAKGWYRKSKSDMVPPEQNE